MIFLQKKNFCLTALILSTLFSGCVFDLDKKEGDPITYTEPKNSWQAVANLKKACKAGDENACKILDDYYAKEAVKDQEIIDYVHENQLNKR